MHSLLELASHAPSVGHCQPWRFVLVELADRRDEVKSSFARANARALENYDGEQRAQYARLKLEGLENAPVHVAVFADEAAEEGSGLGRRTMPETLRYSVVAAIQTLWLAARAEGLGLGWVSILEPEVDSSGARRAANLDAGRLSLHRLAGGGASRSRTRSSSLAATAGCRTDDFQALS